MLSVCLQRVTRDVGGTWHWGWSGIVVCEVQVAPRWLTSRGHTRLLSCMVGWPLPSLASIPLGSICINSSKSQKHKKGIHAVWWEDGSPTAPRQAHSRSSPTVDAQCYPHIAPLPYNLADNTHLLSLDTLLQPPPFQHTLGQVCHRLRHHFMSYRKQAQASRE